MKWVIVNFSLDMLCPPPVRQYQSSQNLLSEVNSCDFYNNFGTQLSKIFDKKTCTVVVAVLTICNVWMMCSLVLM